MQPLRQSTWAPIVAAAVDLPHLAAAVMTASRQIVRGLGVAALITFATALVGHLIGNGRGVPQALIYGMRLGPRGQLAVELGYYVAAGMAAAAAVAAISLVSKRARRKRQVTRSARIPVAVSVVLVCFVAPDFAVGGSPVGAYTSRGAYQFVSEPALHPPIVRADATRPGRLSTGYIFVANFYEPSNPATMVGQSGPLILDQRLSPVWFQPVPENDLAGNLSLQIYAGQPVLAWWQGEISDNDVTQSGEYVVVDQHYKVVARLQGADGWVLTLHEIVIRGDDAWVTATKNVNLDLSRYGGARNGSVIDSAVQEYNLSTGKLVWSWDALDHIPLTDSMTPGPTAGSPWDAYHVNSIDLPGDGSFVVSMRNTWAAYKVRIATGQIDWTLGGKESSFRFGRGADFQWQHNVTLYPGTPLMTVFDDHCCQVTDGGKTQAPTGPSRGLVLKVDPATRSATLADEYVLGAKFDSEYMGDIEPLPGGNEFVGWGSQPHFSEYTAGGRLLLDAVFPSPDISYRAIVEPWVGLPLYPPSAAARQKSGRTIVYASWNGATEVAAWKVLAGSSTNTLEPVTTAPKSGFETAIAVPASPGVFRVQALSSGGKVIGASAPFTIASTAKGRR